MIREVEVDELSWIRNPRAEEMVEAKVRYQMRPAACTIEPTTAGVKVTFAESQKPTAPGQVAAFYAGDELLGGGSVVSAE